ncbi:8-oxo-dGTP diphosphatase [Ligilactobacillus ceti]|uniref:8-oxo-dGTP diphosphatase n=1 Tax=Ligilactobacillus ceti TaxID=395085 RepID=UPI00055568C4|nr:NUDIX domain-containing protein [Ligilactobacillus ceti]
MAENKHKPEQVILTNMCVIEDDQGNVVAIDKVTGSYTGTTFPGGHIEKNEIFNDSIIREVREETGLIIKHPKLKGVYHWYRNDIHYVLFIYHAKDFTGELTSSREGKVYWIELEELKKKKLATGTEHVITMIENDDINECFMKPDGDTYKGELY